MNPIDRVFMDEIKRESYIRPLTDDFSVVDTVVKEDANHEAEGE